jgi:hypothetical protein
MLGNLIVFVVLGDDPCKSGCLCDTGVAKNVLDIWPNATGVLCGHPPNTCEVCSICNNAYPKCPCCNPNFGDSDACLNCRLDPENFDVCGKPAVTYSCDRDASQCNPKTAGGGQYPTKAGCVTACQPSYNCQNKGQGDQCIAAPGTTGTYANLSACNASCSTAPLSPCGRVKPAQCKFWQELFDSTGGTFYPGNSNNWTECGTLRSDPCACGGKGCQPYYGTCVTCANGDITAV